MATTETMDESYPTKLKRRSFAQLKHELRVIKIDAVASIMTETERICLRLFWLAMLLVSASVCLMLAVKSIEEFARYEVTTKMRMITDQEAIFPVITICSLNPFTTPYADELFAEAGVVNSLSNMWLLDKYAQETTGQRLGETQRMSNFADLMVSCSMSLKDCSVNDFQPMIHPVYGNCYRFNSGLNVSLHSVPLVNVTIGGSALAFHLDLYAGFTDTQLMSNSTDLKGLFSHFFVDFLFFQHI